MAPAQDSDAKSEGGDIPSYFKGVIDGPTFEQILEMDDDEDRDFSKSIVFDFFTQAENTFKEMDEAIEKKDFATLSSLGHYLKGSSATLGLTKVKDSCEKIQHLGAHKDETGDNEGYDDAETLTKIKVNVNVAQKEYKVAEKLLRRFFGEPVAESD